MNYLSFKEFVNKYRLKNEATSNVEIKEILKLMNTSCGIYMRDDKFITTSGIVNLHPTKGTHCVMFTRSASGVYEFYLDSYGCPLPLNIAKQINTQSAFGNGIYSEYQIQKDDSYCAAYCLYVLYLTKVIGFKNAVLNLYYQNLYYQTL